MGWPFTLITTARGSCGWSGREYGGDGKTAPADGERYAAPVAAFQPRRPAGAGPGLLLWRQPLPARLYRGGAFLALHGGGDSGPEGQAGYNVMFVPFNGNRAGTPVVFADGFAGPSPGDKNAKSAAYRPVGEAVAPDGSLYVADSNKGRIWRITYGETPN